jgi:hypothetical protein
LAPKFRKRDSESLAVFVGDDHRARQRALPFYRPGPGHHREVEQTMLARGGIVRQFSALAVADDTGPITRWKK